MEQYENLISAKDVYFILDNDKIDCVIKKGKQCVKVIDKQIVPFKQVKNKVVHYILDRNCIIPSKPFDFLRLYINPKNKFDNIYITPTDTELSNIYVMFDIEKYFCIKDLSKITKSLNVEYEKYKKEQDEKQQDEIKKEKLKNRSLEDIVKDL